MITALDSSAPGWLNFLCNLSWGASISIYTRCKGRIRHVLGTPPGGSLFGIINSGQG